MTSQAPISATTRGFFARLTAMYGWWCRELTGIGTNSLFTTCGRSWGPSRIFSPTTDLSMHLERKQGRILRRRNQRASRSIPISLRNQRSEIHHIRASTDKTPPCLREPGTVYNHMCSGFVRLASGHTGMPVRENLGFRNAARPIRPVRICVITELSERGQGRFFLGHLFGGAKGSKHWKDVVRRKAGI
jgi:hypothetical protein